jgi:hypothetical protein
MGKQVENFNSAIPNTEWANNLTSSSADVSVIEKNGHIYAGCNGFVYKLHAKSGELIAKNSMKGTHSHDVLLAISENGKFLFAGTDGYAICIDTDDFKKEVWRKEINSSSKVVSVLLKDEILYAACNGYVRKLNSSNGNIISTNSMKGTHSHDVLLAISGNGKFLFAGTDGYAICIDTDDFKKEVWRKEINSSSKVVTVILKDKILYAACNGYVRKLNSGDGNIISTNSMKGMLSHDVLLAISENGKYLFAGTKGYAICIDTDNFEKEVWRTKVNSSSKIVSLLLLGDFLNTGCNGYFKAINSATGKIVIVNNLKGTNNHTILMTRSEDGRELFLGTDGYALAIPSVNKTSQWMKNLEDGKSKKLNQIAMPGSHNAGMYKSHNCTSGGFACNTETQSQTIYQQLYAGIRYFDLRPILKKSKFELGHFSDDIGDYFAVKGRQGCFGGSLDDGLSDVKAFLEDGNDSEIIILRFSHYYDRDNHKDYFTDNQKDYLVSTVKGKLDKYLLKNVKNKKLLDQSMKDLLEKGNVIPLFSGGSTEPESGIYDSNDLTIYNKYSNTNDVENMSKDQIEKLNIHGGESEQLFLLSWTLTQSNTQAAGCGVDLTSITSSIKDLAQKANDKLPDILGNDVKHMPNIVYTDYCNTFPTLICLDLMKKNFNK